MLVEPDGDARRRFGLRTALVVARHRQRRHGHIEHHEHDDDPRENLAGAHGNLFNPARQHGVAPLEPDDRRDAPEEAVQQVDASAEVERDLAVIPEHRAEHDLREHAAHVFVRAAEHRSRDEHKAVALVAPAVEQGGEHHAAETPHDAERAVHEARAAHPHARCHAAEDRLGEVAQDTADHEQPHQFVKTASCGKHGGLFLCGVLLLGLDDLLDLEVRVRVQNAALDAARHHVAERVCDLSERIADLVHTAQPLLHLQKGRGAGGKVDDEQHRQHPQERDGDPRRHEAAEPEHQRVQKADAQNGEHAPHGRVFQAHVALKLELLARVVPPLAVEDLFQHPAGDELDERRQDHAAEEQEQRPVIQVGQEHREHERHRAVDGAQRHVQKAAVHEPLLLHGRLCRLQQPACERIDEKQPQNGIKSVVHTKPHDPRGAPHSLFFIICGKECCVNVPNTCKAANCIVQ